MDRYGRCNFIFPDDRVCSNLTTICSCNRGNIRLGGGVGRC